MVLHAAEGMDNIGDSQWVVPIDPRSKATFCSVGESRPARGPRSQRGSVEMSQQRPATPSPSHSAVASIRKWPWRMHSPKWPGCRRLSRPWETWRGCRRIVAGRVGKGASSSSVAANRRADLKMQGVHREVRTASGLVGG